MILIQKREKREFTKYTYERSKLEIYFVSEIFRESVFQSGPPRRHLQWFFVISLDCKYLPKAVAIHFPNRRGQEINGMWALSNCWPSKPGDALFYSANGLDEWGFECFHNGYQSTEPNISAWIHPVGYLCWLLGRPGFLLISFSYSRRNIV